MLIPSAKFEALLDPIKTSLQIIPFLLMFFYGGNLESIMQKMKR
jgi:hypothetical protein